MHQSASLAVHARAVVKSFGSGSARQEVLRAVDLDVPIGETTFLVGPSGCGKTTLVSILTGLLEADSGRIELFGTSLPDLGAGALVRFRRDNLGFVFQQFHLLPALDAVDNAAVPLLAQGVPSRRARIRARELLVHLGMEAHLDKFPRALSGGQQQRVAIARALVHRPRLLVCDEPTASLDAATGRQVMELFAELVRAEGVTALVVTHDNRIFDFADRIARMGDGAIVSVESRTAPRAPLTREA